MTDLLAMPSEAHAAGPPRHVTPAHPTQWGRLSSALAVVVLYATAVAPLAYPVFHGAFLVTPRSDQYKGAYIVREFGGAMLRHTGHVPLWNPYLYGGMPFVGAMDGDIYYLPSIVLRLLMRGDLAVSWAFIIHVILAGCFTYGLLRSLRLGRGAAFIGGLAYMMGGPLSSYVSPGHDGKLYVSALLPLALWLLVLGLRDGRRWCWPVLAVVVGCATLSPHVQLLQYALLLAGAFGLHVAFLSADAPTGWVRVRRLGGALGAVALGLALGAIQFLPVFEYTSWSPRAFLASYDFATQFSMPPESLPSIYLPQFTGLLDTYWGRSPFFSDYSNYLGAAVLVLATLGVVAPAKARRRDVWFWTAVALIASVWALGGHTPFYHIVYALVPGTKYFRIPAAMFIVAGLAVAVLAAEGVERALEKHASGAVLVGWTVFALLLATSVAPALSALAGRAAGLPWAVATARDNARSIEAGGLRSLVIVLLIAAVVLVRRAGRLPRFWACVAIAAVVWVDLWSVARFYWTFSPPASVLYAEDAAVRYVRADLARTGVPARVLSWSMINGTGTKDPELSGDAWMLHRVRNVLGYHGNEIRRYDDLSYSATGAKPLFTPRLWQLLNVRFIITDIDSLARRVPGASLVLGPVRDPAGSSIYVYRVSGENPLAWVTPRSTLVRPERASVVVDPHFDIGRTALITTDSSVPPLPWSAPVLEHDLTVGAADDTARSAPGVAVSAYAPGHMSFQLERAAGARSTLVVSENYYPGWRATIDGRPAVARAADYTLIGIPLPVGSRSVELIFTSPASERGAAITEGVLLLIVLWGAAAVWGRARSTASGSR